MVRLTGITVVDALLITAAVLGALGVIFSAIRGIWRRLLRPLIRAAGTVEVTLPVVLDIANEFKADHGSSLRDLLDQLARDARELSEYAHGFRHDFVNRFATMAGNQDVMADRLDELTQEVAAVKADISNVKQIIDSRKKPR